jgi:hypothetical protein
MGYQLQPSAVQTPAAVPLAPDTLRSTKLPAATATLPVTVQLDPEAATQASAVSAIVPADPVRSVTVTALACRENTVSELAVQAVGTHVITESSSPALAFALLTE